MLWCRQFFFFANKTRAQIIWLDSSFTVVPHIFFGGERTTFPAPNTKPEMNGKVLPLFFCLSNSIQMSLVNFIVYAALLLSFSGFLPSSKSVTFSSKTEMYLKFPFTCLPSSRVSVCHVKMYGPLYPQ